MQNIQRGRDFKLLKAAVVGNVDHVRELLRDGANVNVDGDTAEFAAFSKKTRCIGREARTLGRRTIAFGQRCKCFDKGSLR